MENASQAKPAATGQCRSTRNVFPVPLAPASDTLSPFPLPNSQAAKTMNFSSFAQSLTTETAFDVLAVAKRLKAGGKDVIELQIGDSPFPSTKSALAAGKKAIDDGATRYCPSMGL